MKNSTRNGLGFVSGLTGALLVGGLVLHDCDGKPEHGASRVTASAVAVTTVVAERNRVVRASIADAEIPSAPVAASDVPASAKPKSIDKSKFPKWIQEAYPALFDEEPEAASLEGAKQGLAMDILDKLTDSADCLKASEGNNGKKSLTVVDKNGIKYDVTFNKKVLGGTLYIQNMSAQAYGKDGKLAERYSLVASAKIPEEGVDGILEGDYDSVLFEITTSSGTYGTAYASFGEILNTAGIGGDKLKADQKILQLFAKLAGNIFGDCDEE